MSSHASDHEKLEELSAQCALIIVAENANTCAEIIEPATAALEARAYAAKLARELFPFNAMTKATPAKGTI